eukprot:7827755-Pyramimonas_sp.AAC.1
MALKGNSTEALTKTKLEMDTFLRDKSKLAAVREKMNSGNATEEQLKVNTARSNRHGCLS